MIINAKIYLELNGEDLISIVQLPENLSAQDQMLFSEKLCTIILMMKNGEILPSLIQSIVEAGILTDQKNLSELIIKKIVQSFSLHDNNLPVVLPSEAFLFREKE